MQGAQHRFHNTSWYKDVKKLEDIVNHVRQKRCICQIMEFSFSRYGMIKTRKLLSRKGYEKSRNSLIKHLKGIINNNNICNSTFQLQINIAKLGVPVPMVY